MSPADWTSTLTRPHPLRRADDGVLSLLDCSSILSPKCSGAQSPGHLWATTACASPTCGTTSDWFVIAALRDLVAQLRYRHAVHELWGFARGDARGQAITALFAGPSGTGRALAAEVIARETSLDLYHVDLSQVVDKYVGETEKRLRRIFDAAEAGGAILLFDEADALFGKRAQVERGMALIAGQTSRLAISSSAWRATTASRSSRQTRKTPLTRHSCGVSASSCSSHFQTCAYEPSSGAGRSPTMHPAPGSTSASSRACSDRREHQ